MPDAIQSFSPSSSSVASASTEENAGQVCLSPPAQNASASRATPAADVPPQSPAVPALVARFSAPTGSHSPVEPSLAKAIANCSWEVASASVAVGAVLVAAPAGLVTAAITGARGVIGLGTAERCIERDEARQVAEGQKANQAEDCERDGAVPLVTVNAHGSDSVICARP